MSLPAGVTTATVTAGVPVTHTGAGVKTFVSVEPSVFLVHAATGTPLVDFLEELNISEGVAGSFVLPHTDQTGFQDENGNAYSNWYYTARVTYSTPSKAKNKTPKVKVFQLTTGQVTVDLDLLPSGAPALPYIAPSAKVEAFHGRTGAVTLQESDLPDRLSEGELSATYVGKDDLYFNVRDYGAVGDGITDDTAAFIDANDWAAQVNGSVVIPGSAAPYMVDNLAITNHKGRWVGLGSGIMGSADGTGTTKAGAVLKRISGSTNPLLRIVANGITLQNVFLDGNGGAGTGLQIDRGFEVKLNSVFVENVAGIGLDVQGACNTDFSGVFVNHCGTATVPAVRVAVGETEGVSINTLDFTGLTIEQCRGPFLDVGIGSMAYYPEFLRITNLHIELDNLTSGFAANNGPLVRMGNARSVCLVNPFIVGGPGPLIQYNRTQGALGDVLGGLQIIGGTLYGRDDEANMPATLVDLVAGDGFIMAGTRIDNVTGQAVNIGAGFGSNVEMSAISTTSLVAKLSTDARDMKPTFTAGAQAGASAPVPAAGSGANDTRGAFFFGTGTGPAAGEMADVVFKEPYDTAPTVNLTPGNGATAALGTPYVDSSATGFSVFVPAAPAASQAAGAYFMYYSVTP